MIHGTRFHRLLSTSCLSAAVMVAVSSGALANPEGGVVSAGSVTITSSGAKLDIYQTTDRAVIDWRSFDIGAGEHTQFYQPSSNSIAVNRIGAGSPSVIAGKLSANGNIVLVNPNGVLFTGSSVVDVGGLVATSSNVSNESVLAGGTLQFNQAGNSNAFIINDGQITVRDAGLVGFVAPNVINNGIITARLGKAHLASGDSATIDFYGDGLINVAVSDAVTSQLVSNTGIISASGGTIALTAAAGKEIVNSVINVEGILEARSVAERNGTIIISAEGSNAVAGNVAADKGQKSGASAIMIHEAILDISGRNAGERGGRLSVIADYIALLANTIIDASGHTGLSNTTAGKNISDARIGAAGGDIQIGGDYLGLGITPTARSLFVESEVFVFNDAIHEGDAGRTIFWSDETTGFFGNVYARALGGLVMDAITGYATAGGNAGMGGFVETSGKKHLDAGGYVDLTASNGARGTYFLDPTDITIYGNVDPAFTSTDGTLNLASSLRLWLDASDTANVNLTFNSLGTTATGTSGSNTITVSANTGLVVGARIRLGAAGAVTAASTLGADTYTISNIVGTTITLSSNLTANYTASAVYQGYVSQLSDKSGQSNNATQGAATNMPLWLSNGQNGIGAARFDGVNDFLTVTDADSLDNTNGLTIFTVDTPTLFDGNPKAIFSKRVGSGNNDAYSLFYFTGNAPAVDIVTTNNRFLSPTASTVNNTDQFTLLYDGTLAAGSRSRLYTKGALSITATETSTSIPNYASNLSIGVLGGNASSYFSGTVPEMALFNTALTTNARQLVEQYQSAKWGVALTPPGTGATEVAKATASDGYSVFTTRYLERLSQSANVSLQATNNINLDFKGDTLNFTTAGRTLTLNAGNQITTASAGGITTNNAAISLTGANGINFAHAFTLNSGTAATTLTTTAGSIVAPSISAGSVAMTSGGASSDITIAAGRTLTASGTGNAITLVSGRNFINSSGSATPLSAASGRWLVYSANPASDTLGGMTSDFRRFSCAYASPGACSFNATLGTTMTLPNTGNGFAYSITPTLTATPSVQNITYGDVAPSLVGYAVGLTGYLGSDSSADTLGGALTGTTTYSAGNAIGTYNINYSSGTLSSALGYGLTYASNANGISVGQRALTVTTDAASKSFGATDPVFTGSNNLIASDIPLIGWAYAPSGYSGAVGSYTIEASATDASSRLANYIRTNNYGVFTVTSAAISQIPNQVISSFNFIPPFSNMQMVAVPSIGLFSLGNSGIGIGSIGTFDSIGNIGSSTPISSTSDITIFSPTNTDAYAPVPNPFITITPELRAWLEG